MNPFSLAMWRGLTSDVRCILFSSVLLAFTLFGGIYSVLFNLYLLRLGCELQFIGAVNASGALAFASISLFSGMLGQRWGSRRLVIAGIYCTVLGHGFVPLATGLEGDVQTYWLLFTFGFGAVGMNMYFVNIFPFLMSKTQPHERNRIFSLQVAIWPLAACSGALIGGFLPGWFAVITRAAVESPSTYGYALALAAVLLMPAVIALYRTTESTEHLESLKTPQLQRAKIPYGLIIAMAAVTLFQTVGESAIRIFYNTYLDNGLGLSTELIGALSAAGQLLAVGAALCAPALAVRWNRSGIIMGGAMGVVVFLIPLALVPLWWVAGLAYMGLIGMGALRRPAFILFQQEIVAPNQRVMMSSAVSMAYGIGSTAIGLGGGYVIAEWGYRVLFLMASGLVLVGVFWFWGYFMRGAQRE